MKRLSILLLFSLLLAITRTADYVCEQYEFWTTQACGQCSPNCKCIALDECDEAICGNGEIAYDYQCYPLPAGCTKANYLSDRQWECTECSDSYQNIDGVCLLKILSSTVSTSDYTENRFSSSLLQFPIGLYLNCDNRNDTSLLCTKCLSGYYQDINLYCEKCTPGCLTCKVATLCEKCKDGYYLKKSISSDEYQQKCLSCTVGAQTCATDQIHLTCKPEYYFNTLTSLCSNCISSCIACNTATTCTTCDTAFFFDGSSCTFCGTGCKSCSSATLCSTCFDDYLKFDSKCYKCSLSCAKCTYSNNVQTCTQCADGYYGIASPDLSISCSACSIQNVIWMRCKQQADLTIIPTQCISGYNLVANTCVQNLKDCYVFCLMLANGDCSSCLNTDYAISTSDKSCKICSIQFTYCKTCASDFSKCTLCVDGYSPSSNGLACIQNIVCDSTVSNCKTCSPATSCSICNDQYYSYMKEELKYCQKCPSGCTKCSGSQNVLGVKCTECVAQYFLKGDGCLPAQNFCVQPSDDGTNCIICSYGTFPINGRCVPQMDVLAGYRIGVNVGFTDDQLSCIINYKDYGGILSVFLTIISLIFS